MATREPEGGAVEIGTGGAERQPEDAGAWRRPKAAVYFASL